MVIPALLGRIKKHKERDMENKETEKKAAIDEQKSNFYRLLTLLESNGYYVWSIHKEYTPAGLITIAISPDRKS
jgi:hypothetical protein